MTSPGLNSFGFSDLEHFAVSDNHILDMSQLTSAELEEPANVKDIARAFEQDDLPARSIRSAPSNDVTESDSDFQEEGSDEESGEASHNSEEDKAVENLDDDSESEPDDDDSGSDSDSDSDSDSGDDFDYSDEIVKAFQKSGVDVDDAESAEGKRFPIAQLLGGKVSRSKKANGSVNWVRELYKLMCGKDRVTKWPSNHHMVKMFLKNPRTAYNHLQALLKAHKNMPSTSASPKKSARPKSGSRKRRADQDQDEEVVSSGRVQKKARTDDGPSSDKHDDISSSPSSQKRPAEQDQDEEVVSSGRAQKKARTDDEQLALTEKRVAEDEFSASVAKRTHASLNTVTVQTKLPVPRPVPAAKQPAAVAPVAATQSTALVPAAGAGAKFSVGAKVEKFIANCSSHGIFTREDLQNAFSVDLVSPGKKLLVERNDWEMMYVSQAQADEWTSILYLYKTGFWANIENPEMFPNGEKLVESVIIYCYLAGEVEWKEIEKPAPPALKDFFV